MFVAIGVAIVMGYLCGSVPVGYIVGRLYRGVDVREYGSRRTGATNVLRTLGPGAAVMVALGDAVKGVIAVEIGQLATAPYGVEAQHGAIVCAALAALAGHNWSIFMRWRGGRGVLVSAGALAVLFPPAFVVSAIVALVVIGLFRFVSLGSLVGAILAALLILGAIVEGREPPIYALFAVLGAAVIILQHRDNIERLRSGTERKLGQQVRLPPTGTV
ncbi:MAG: glycerol-3-phosphate 1-O-acyltransferase PlsY [Chloroflexi bacterium]|nr:glycerol-3-phosphate 1-O-acyltransferase PlsY [Chloroflexota bacterium]